MGNAFSCSFQCCVGRESSLEDLHAPLPVERWANEQGPKTPRRSELENQGTQESAVRETSAASSVACTGNDAGSQDIGREAAAREPVAEAPRLQGATVSTQQIDTEASVGSPVPPEEPLKEVPLLAGAAVSTQQIDTEVSVREPIGEVLRPEDSTEADVLEGGAVLAKGSKVKVRSTGRIGDIVVENDGSELPYKISFDDGATPSADWFPKGALQPVDEPIVRAASEAREEAVLRLSSKQRIEAEKASKQAEEELEAARRAITEAEVNDVDRAALKAAFLEVRNRPLPDLSDPDVQMAILLGNEYTEIVPHLFLAGDYNPQKVAYLNGTIENTVPKFGFVVRCSENPSKCVETSGVPFFAFEPKKDSEGRMCVGIHSFDLEAKSDLLKLKDCCIQIKAKLDQQCNVLVHCQQGVDRSATVVAAFCMAYFNISTTDAREILKRLRPACTEQVPGYEELLRANESKIRQFYDSTQGAAASVHGQPASSSSSDPRRGQDNDGGAVENNDRVEKVTKSAQNSSPTLSGRALRSTDRGKDLFKQRQKEMQEREEAEKEGREFKASTTQVIERAKDLPAITSGSPQKSPDKGKDLFKQRQKEMQEREEAEKAARDTDSTAQVIGAAATAKTDRMPITVQKLGDGKWRIHRAHEDHLIKLGLEVLDRTWGEDGLLEFPKRKFGPDSRPAMYREPLIRSLMTGERELKSTPEVDVSIAQGDIKHMNLRQLLRLRTLYLDFEPFRHESTNAHASFLQSLNDRLFDQLAQKALGNASSGVEITILRRFGFDICLLAAAGDALCSHESQADAEPAPEWWTCWLQQQRFFFHVPDFRCQVEFPECGIIGIQDFSKPDGTRHLIDWTAKLLMTEEELVEFINQMGQKAKRSGPSISQSELDARLRGLKKVPVFPT